MLQESDSLEPELDKLEPQFEPDQPQEPELILYRLRYWDIADSEDGDYTASVRLSITNRPKFIISNPYRSKGKWGLTFPFIKLKMLEEPHVVHIFETAGVGGIAWQTIQMDASLAHINKLPATRIFTGQSKEERAQLWALELQNGRMAIIKDSGYQDVIEEIEKFPHFTHDDYIDSISGGMLGFIYFYGGYSKLLKSKLLKPQTLGKEMSYEKENLIRQLSGW